VAAKPMEFVLSDSRLNARPPSHVSPGARIASAIGDSASVTSACQADRSADWTSNSSKTKLPTKSALTRLPLQPGKPTQPPQPSASFLQSSSSSATTPCRLRFHFQNAYSPRAGRLACRRERWPRGLALIRELCRAGKPDANKAAVAVLEEHIVWNMF
jgi:hypothetical protein